VIGAKLPKEIKSRLIKMQMLIKLNMWHKIEVVLVMSRKKD